MLLANLFCASPSVYSHRDLFYINAMMSARHDHLQEQQAKTTD